MQWDLFKVQRSLLQFKAFLEFKIIKQHEEKKADRTLNVNHMWTSYPDNKHIELLIKSDVS